MHPVRPSMYVRLHSNAKSQRRRSTERIPRIRNPVTTRPPTDCKTSHAADAGGHGGHAIRMRFLFSGMRTAAHWPTHVRTSQVHEVRHRWDPRPDNFCDSYFIISSANWKENHTARPQITAQRIGGKFSVLVKFIRIYATCYNFITCLSKYKCNRTAYFH